MLLLILARLWRFYFIFKGMGVSCFCSVTVSTTRSIISLI